MTTVCSILTLILHSVSVSVMKACKIDEKVFWKLPAANEVNYTCSGTPK